MIDVHTETDPIVAASAAGAALTSCLREAGGKPVLLLLSGGSALKIIDFITPAECVDCHLTVGVLDERISADPKVNNFAQMEEKEFFKKMIANGANFIDTKVAAGELPQEAAARWQETIKAWRMSNSDGLIIITQGIGADGHTAGIMPYPEDERAFGFLFDDDSAWVVGYDAGAKSEFPLRMTVTLPFLRLVDTAFVYMVGTDKKAMLEAVMKSKDDVYKIPGRIIHQMKHCFLFTDQSVVTV